MDNIDNYVKAWHEGNSDREFRGNLEMTIFEYSSWVADPNVLPSIIAAHREGKNISKVL